MKGYPGYLQFLNRRAAEQELAVKGKKLADYPWPEDKETPPYAPFVDIAETLKHCLCIETDPPEANPACPFFQGSEVFSSVHPKKR